MGDSARIDRTRVMITTEGQRLYWATRLRSAVPDIKQAIAEVGDAPGDVESWLASRHRRRLIPGEEDARVTPAPNARDWPRAGARSARPRRRGAHGGGVVADLRDRRPELRSVQTSRWHQRRTSYALSMSMRCTFAAGIDALLDGLMVMLRRNTGSIWNRSPPVSRPGVACPASAHASAAHARRITTWRPPGSCTTSRSASVHHRRASPATSGSPGARYGAVERLPAREPQPLADAKVDAARGGDRNPPAVGRQQRHEHAPVERLDRRERRGVVAILAPPASVLAPGPALPSPGCRGAAARARCPRCRSAEARDRVTRSSTRAEWPRPTDRVRRRAARRPRASCRRSRRGACHVRNGTAFGVVVAASDAGARAIVGDEKAAAGRGGIEPPAAAWYRRVGVARPGAQHDGTFERELGARRRRERLLACARAGPTPMPAARRGRARRRAAG